MTEVRWMETFAGNFRELLKESGYSQKEFAQMADIAESTVSKLLNGQMMPSVKTLVNIAYALDANINELSDFGDMIY